MSADKRVHGSEAAGAGDLDDVAAGDLLGPCPSCAAGLRVGYAKHPRTGRIARALMHPVPFCTYYGAADPTVIERDVEDQMKGKTN